MKNELLDVLQKAAVTLNFTAEKIINGEEPRFAHTEKIRKVASTLFSLADKIQMGSINVPQSTRQRPKKVKPKKCKRNNAERDKKIRKAVKLYWEQKWIGKKVTRGWAAVKCGLEASALSKKWLPKVMKEDIPNATKDVRAFKCIRQLDDKAIKILLVVVDKVLDEFLK